MKRFISNLLTVCFICYMILLVYFLFFSEEYGRNEPYTTYQYNLELFREIKRYLMYREQIGMVYFAINLLGNVVVFMPFGFLVPILGRKKRKFWFTALLGFELSLSVECIQLVTKTGCFDVDDIFLNTIGGMLGYLVYALMQRKRDRDADARRLGEQKS